MNNSFTVKSEVATIPVKISSVDIIRETTYDDWSTVVVCDGAVCKRIKTPTEYNGFLVKYDTGAMTLKHQNDNEYEILDIRIGSIRNLVTNEVYYEGDAVMFDKGEVHQLYCEDEAYVYCILSKKKRVLR